MSTIVIHTCDAKGKAIFLPEQIKMIHQFFDDYNQRVERNEHYRLINRMDYDVMRFVSDILQYANRIYTEETPFFQIVDTIEVFT